MALLKKWRDAAYSETANKGDLQRFWAKYFEEEKEIYAQLLKNPDEVVTGTVKELAEKYDESLKNTIAFGASPRATIALDKCAKINAWLSGRDFVTPEDIHAVVYDVLRHRIILSFEAQAGGLTSDDIITRLLKIVPLP